VKVLVAHNAIAASETDPSTLDVLEQARFLSEALAQSGHGVELLPFDRNLRAILERIERAQPEIVFNLVESVEGDARLHPAAAAFFELLGLPHTGSPARALELTTDKHMSKVLMRDAGIPTPEWTCVPAAVISLKRPIRDDLLLPYILKPAWEDASVGIDEDSVVRDHPAFHGKLAEMRERFPTQPILVEHFIEGREFNVSLLAGGEGVEALPIAEIIFDGYGPGKERVVGYRAKWDPASPEYHNTRRSYERSQSDSALIDMITEISLACWELFDLHGYARVDLRVDESGQPYVIEVNANPCLSPDAGFAAAAERAGISPGRVAQRILEDAVCPPQQPT
jgi:D-alanine-D-alanine ligase